MTKLTQKQEGFTLDIFKGMTQRKSYQANYNCKNMSLDAIDVEACKLSANPKISQRLAELNSAVSVVNIMTVTKRKEFLSELATKNKDISTNPVTAIQELNKMEHVYDETSRPTQAIQIVINMPGEQIKENIIEGEIIV